MLQERLMRCNRDQQGVQVRETTHMVRDSRCSPCILKTPEEDILQSRPSSEITLMKGLGEQGDQESAFVTAISKAPAANRIQSPIVSLGHRAQFPLRPSQIPPHPQTTTIPTPIKETPYITESHSKSRHSSRRKPRKTHQCNL